MITWIGFRFYESANKLQKQLGDGYVVVTITADSFDGEVLGWVVMRKDIDPVGGEP